MKTAMQELIEWHRKSMRSYSETNKIIESFMEKEKEQIIDAYKSGVKLIAGDIEDASKYYYKQTYNQNK